MVWPPTADQPSALRDLYEASSERFAFPMTDGYVSRYECRVM